MDSRNYEQLITGSSAVWRVLDVDGTGRGVGSQHKLYSHCLVQSIIQILQLSTFIISCKNIFVVWDIHVSTNGILSQFRPKHGVLGEVDYAIKLGTILRTRKPNWQTSLAAIEKITPAVLQTLVPSIMAI